MKKKTEANISRLSLRGWAALDDLRRQIENRAEEGRWSAVPELIFQTIELSTKVDRDAFWQDVVNLYTQVIELNLPTKKFPVLSSKEKGKPLPWEYEGRSWYFWLNLFASRYGWKQDEIANLDIDDALGLYEEILVDQQLDQEWEWGLSEVSYSYNKSTKKMNFNRLPRPDWMKPIMGAPKPIKTSPMHPALFPQGNIVILDEQPPNSVKSE